MLLFITYVSAKYKLYLQSKTGPSSCLICQKSSYKLGKEVKKKERKRNKQAFEQPQWMAKAQPQSCALGDGGRGEKLSVLALEDFSELEPAGTPELLWV